MYREYFHQPLSASLFGLINRQGSLLTLDVRQEQGRIPQWVCWGLVFPVVQYDPLRIPLHRCPKANWRWRKEEGLQRVCLKSSEWFSGHRQLTFVYFGAVLPDRAYQIQYLPDHHWMAVLQ